MTSLAAHRLADCDRRMSDHLAELARNLWGVGHVCIEVDRDELYREGGFANVFEWAAARHKSSRRTIEKAMMVATHFNAEMAERHGTEKLAATVAYLETTNRIERSGEANALQFRVPGKGGKFESIPFESASSNDIARARELVVRTRRPDGVPPKPDEGANRRARSVATVLAPTPKAVARGPRVEVSRDSDGRHRYTFRAVAEDELEAFARAVLASLA